MNEPPLIMDQSPTPIRRLPGSVPPEAAELALNRLLEAMQVLAGTTPRAADLYRAAFKVALSVAPYGAHGRAVTIMLEAMGKRFDAHVATMPTPPTDAAA